MGLMSLINELMKFHIGNPKQVPVSAVLMIVVVHIEQHCQQICLNAAIGGMPDEVVSFCDFLEPRWEWGLAARIPHKTICDKLRKSANCQGGRPKKVK